MAKRLELVPEGFPVTFAECPPGFFMQGKDVFMKTEYGEGEAFCESGEAYWGGVTTPEARAKIQVQPLVSKWVQFEA